MDDIPKFETWSEADKVGKLFAWYYLLRSQHEEMQRLRIQLDAAQQSFKEATAANRELLRKLKGQNDDDWK